MKTSKNPFIGSLLLFALFIIVWELVHQSDKNVSPREMKGKTVLFANDSAYYIKFKIDTIEAIPEDKYKPERDY